MGNTADVMTREYTELAQSYIAQLLINFLSPRTKVFDDINKIYERYN